MKSRAIKKIMALVIIAALAVTMAVTLAACDNTGSGADIAILVPSADHGWTGAILSNANAWAAEINAEGTYSAKVITATGDADQRSQIEDIAANKNYKAVVILPYSNAVESSMEILASSGIPFIMVDRIIDSVTDDAVATVKGDNYQIGYKTGERFIDQGLNNDSKILIIPGDNSTVPTTRNEGFFAALAAEGLNITIDSANVEVLPSTDWSRANAKTSFISFVEGNTDFGDYDFIFTHDSELAMGIFEVLNESGLTAAQKNTFFGNGEVVLASSSGLDEAYAVLRGETYQDSYSKLKDFFDVTYPPEMIATALDLMVEYLDNGSVANDTIVVEVDVVDETNVDQFKGFK
ncbi:MAG TPA: substrate-binding domain-containing protein [Candidatus Limadaptatus stercorigallinarum]|uniref:Substrate-binding domain-containing protein n=1 Tax=Candidatus Limadaptatus stercorigallinarum TaxID=2840845 RepID=A0A9D1HUK9_9FIRM|nr:substrate-binding domain-containing protein [Candidatus Limadaptatus stercorigallinarum]